MKSTSESIVTIGSMARRNSISALAYAAAYPPLLHDPPLTSPGEMPKSRLHRSQPGGNVALCWQHALIRRCSR
jgi:hypothetical protein